MSAAASAVTAKTSANPTTVAIIGAGPVGLAAAAHVLERGMTPIVIERGPQAGWAVRHWGHVAMFSNWAFNIDAAAARLLAAAGWSPPDPEAFPTGRDLVRDYVEPLASRTPLRDAIRYGTEVVAVARARVDKVRTDERQASPFEVRLRHDGREERLRADAVIDASGTWFDPNPAGANGLSALGEEAAAARIRYGMPDVQGADRARYAGRRVAVLGGGHSAIGTLIDLAALAREVPGTTVLWLYRGKDLRKAFGGQAADQLAARGALGSSIADLVTHGAIAVETGFRLDRIEADGERLRLVAGEGCCARAVGAEELIVATGFRPNLTMLREVRLALDPALECPAVLAPLIDPNEHSCGSVRPHGAAELAHPDRGLYIAGMKSYGRAPTFLLATGYEQVRSIVAEIAGDIAAARRVELVLPETGVCSGPRLAGAPSGAAASGGGCCAPAAPARVPAEAVA